MFFAVHGARCRWRSAPTVQAHQFPLAVEDRHRILGGKRRTRADEATLVHLPACRLEMHGGQRLDP